MERPKQVSKKRSGNIEEMKEQQKGDVFSSSSEGNNERLTTFNFPSDDEIVTAPKKIVRRTTADNDAAESD